MQHLAGTYHVIEPAHYLGYRREAVPTMHPVEIEIVVSQAAQAGIERLHHIFAMVSARVRFIGTSHHAVFAGQHDIFRAPGR